MTDTSADGVFLSDVPVIEVAEYLFRPGDPPPPGLHYITTEPRRGQLKVFEDGAFGFELHEHATFDLSRALSHALNDVVWKVGYKPLGRLVRNAGRFDRAQRNRYTFAFALAHRPDIDCWILASPHESEPDGLPILAGGDLAFLVRQGVTAREANRLVHRLNAEVAYLAYWDHTDHPISDSQMPPGSVGLRTREPAGLN